MADIARLFSTPVYVNKIVGSELNLIQDEIERCIPNISFDGALPVWGKTTELTSLSDDIIEEQNLESFKHMLSSNLEMFCNGLGFEPRPVFERKSWLTKNVKNGYTHVHNHTISDMSGCYYYKTNGKDGSIFFTNPNLAGTTSYILQNLPLNISMEPEIGTLLLFPGYLMHGVQTNTTNEERMSLSFSIIFERWKS